jgi:hypothetical protein
LPAPILQLAFNTYLSPSSAKVYLDSANLFGHRLNCDCEALSTANSDSVEIDFTSGCSDSLILAAMQSQPPFSIVSIQPNPASSSIAVTVSGVREPGSGIDIEMFDVLGERVGIPSPSSFIPQPSSFAIDVSQIPSGLYFIRLSQDGYVQTRSVAIER